jgi:Fe-S cluster assembly iron-binding protein IscA
MNKLKEKTSNFLREVKMEYRKGSSKREFITRNPSSKKEKVLKLITYCCTLGS